ncbi:NnrS family protein [Rhodobacteraceae bacterium CCMM004]|nr:NnrS family protein [Rhodobacteraceae bacterium CCMM004]
MTAILSRLFGEGFRIFFLAAGLFGLVSVLYWEMWLGVHALGGMVSDHPFAQAPHLWHAHEMIFGYAGAALGGFFLTAVPNWTGAKAARHVFIAGAAGLWLAGRVALWLSASLPPVLVATVDLAFVPLLAAKILSQLLKRPKPQNMMFLGLLALLWLSNAAVHADWIGIGGPGAEVGLRAGLLAVCATIAVLGGRVTPAFTRNAMVRAGREDRLPRAHRPLEIPGIALAVLLPAAVLAGVGDVWAGAVAVLCGTAQLLRLAGWRGLWTLGQPILWSLHLAFAMLGIGYLLLGLAWLGWGSEVAALHVLGIGAVGGMTLAVMSRAILGHTGRALVAPGPIALAFALMALAAVVRWIGSSAGMGGYFAAMLIAGAAWSLAMALFVATLLPALLGPKVRD